MKLMGRHVSLESFERAARAMLAEVIRVRVDLILGLPDDPVGWASEPVHALPPATSRSLAFTLWLKSSDFRARACEAVALVRQVLSDNPHTTLQIVLEPCGDPRHLEPDLLEDLLAACHESLSYLDWFYSLHPVRLLGAKRLVVLLPGGAADLLEEDWREAIEERAAVVYISAAATTQDPTELVSIGESGWTARTSTTPTTVLHPTPPRPGGGGGRDGPCVGQAHAEGDLVAIPLLARPRRARLDRRANRAALAK